MYSKEIEEKGALIIKSQINGTFYGFKDDVLFPLTNGQYWVQSKYNYWYHYAYMPHVKIYEHQGGCFLTIDGLSQVAEVKRATNVIKSTIVSEFKGWSGNTEFKLSNGQVWRQNQHAYHHSSAHRPTAVIYRAGNRYRILVGGHSVTVKQIK